MQNATEEEILFDDAQPDDPNIEQVGAEIPPESRTLRTQAYDKSVGDLVAMVIAGDILLDPDYQRNYVWDNPKASLLIESFLLNVPIPIIYVSEEADGAWSVVDGLQRLTSLKRFFEDDFRLSKLEVFQELNGLTFSRLPPKAQRTLKNGILRIIVILQESHPEIKYDIFQRLNRGSIKLNEQELRNCLYRGPLTSALREARKEKNFLEIIGLAEPHKRFYDAELILRSLAMGEAFDPVAGGVPSYPNKMKSFLNSYMERNKKLSKADIEIKLAKFRDVVGAVQDVFGAPAFRRPIGDGDQTDTRLNRALMDAIVASFWQFDRLALAAKAAEIRSMNARLVREDAAFADALIYGTSDRKKVEYRVKTWHSHLVALMAD